MVKMEQILCSVTQLAAQKAHTRVHKVQKLAMEFYVR